ncbi:MAG: MarR family transcriptional regulator [Marmoricola sp.]|nr:MarR family transcriptional regulator [Marmoricola sp.]
MSKSSSLPPGHEAAPGGEVWVDTWQQTSTLLTLRSLTRLAEQVTPAVARRADLTHNELRALENLMDQPMGPGELGRVLGVSSAAASGIIDRLEARGHAQRTAHVTDGRRTAVTISPSGRSEIVAHLMPMFRELAELDAALTDADREVVDRYLVGAVRALRTVL